MRLALVGTGRMGAAVEEVARQRGHEIAARFNSGNPLPEASQELGDADVVVDFSRPEVAADHVERYCRWRVPAVVGTTGWYERLDEVSGWVRDHDASLLYAPNFSMGIALLARALRAVLPLLDKLPEYDPYIHEIHHVNKVDSPSGTALMLGRLLVDGLARKRGLESETQHQRIEEEAVHVTSTRAGGVFGTHTVGFDSPFDEITMVHRAKDRKGFAFGAVRSAEWLPGKFGLFTLDDVLGTMDA